MAVKRANRKSNLLGTSLFKLPKGSLYRSTGASGSLGSFGARNPGTRNKGQAGYYSTGEGERKTVMINGQPVRMAPNSSITPNRPSNNVFTNMMNALTGNYAQNNSNINTAVGGSLSGIPLQTPQLNTGGVKVEPKLMPVSQFGNLGSGSNAFNATQQFYSAVGSALTQGAQSGFGLGYANQAPSYGGSYNPTMQNTIPAFSSAGSLARLNEAYSPSIQTGYADYGQRINQGTTPTNALPVTQSSPVVTPSTRAAGQAQFLAGQGINPNSGYIPTRNDVWEMKANQRRRRAAKNGYDEVAPAPVIVPADGSNVVDSAASTAMRWRIGF